MSHPEFLVDRWTDRTRKVMDLAIREALSLGFNYIPPECILLGLVREGESIAAQVLEGFDVRGRVMARLKGESLAPVSASADPRFCAHVWCGDLRCLYCGAGQPGYPKMSLDGTPSESGPGEGGGHDYSDAKPFGQGDSSDALAPRPSSAVEARTPEPPCRICGRTEYKVGSHDQMRYCIHCGKDHPENVAAPGASAVTYDRKVLIDILVYHYRTNTSGCGCGWAELGKSHPEHVANVYEESMAALDSTAAKPTPKPQDGPRVSPYCQGGNHAPCIGVLRDGWACKCPCHMKEAKPCRRCGAPISDVLNLLDGYCKICFVAEHPSKSEQEAALGDSLDKLLQEPSSRMGRGEREALRRRLRSMGFVPEAADEPGTATFGGSMFVTRQCGFEWDEEDDEGKGVRRTCILMDGHETHLASDGNGQPFASAPPKRDAACGATGVVKLEGHGGFTVSCDLDAGHPTGCRFNVHGETLPASLTFGMGILGQAQRSRHRPCPICGKPQFRETPWGKPANWLHAYESHGAECPGPEVITVCDVDYAEVGETTAARPSASIPPGLFNNVCLARGVIHVCPFCDWSVLHTEFDPEGIEAAIADHLDSEHQLVHRSALDVGRCRMTDLMDELRAALLREHDANHATSFDEGCGCETCQLILRVWEHDHDGPVLLNFDLAGDVTGATDA